MHYIESDEIFKDYKSGRFLYLNAWRNISDTPIGNNHLAVCDETSLVAPDDYIPTDLLFQVLFKFFFHRWITGGLT